MRDCLPFICTRSSAAQMRMSFSCVSVSGVSDPVAECAVLLPAAASSAASGGGSAARLIFPFGVSGIACRITTAAGTMYTGSFLRRNSRS